MYEYYITLELSLKKKKKKVKPHLFCDETVTPAGESLAAIKMQPTKASNQSESLVRNCPMFHLITGL